MDMDAGGLELFEGGVIGEGLFLVGERASVEVAEGAGARGRLKFVSNSRAMAWGRISGWAYGFSLEGWAGGVFYVAENSRFT
ncbi:hypothetical protein ACFW2Y_00080 [Streptomyces sp. NPDC058877]|uniref:hypothetical protein n=1 Tax=Streptomyces sp. NPDC058877 TaxID=3346665 RepID=UPI0036936F4B